MVDRCQNSKMQTIRLMLGKSKVKTKQKLKNIALQCQTPPTPTFSKDQMSDDFVEIPVEQPQDVKIVKPGFSKKTSSFYLRTLERIKEKGITFMLHEHIRNNDIDQFMITLQQAKQQSKSGIDVNNQYVLKQMKFIHRFLDTSNGKASLLHTAAKHDNVQVMEILTNELNANMEVKDSIGATPVFYAVANRSSRVGKYLFL